MSDWVVTITVALITGLVAWATAHVTARSGRIRDLSDRVGQVETRNHKLWVYCRKLIDHIYRGLGPPPPPPDDLNDLF